jgi:hypothetical protein
MRPKLIVGAICVLSAATFAACQPSQSLDAAAKDETPLSLAAQPAPKATPAKAQTKKAVAKRDAKTPAVSNAVASTNTVAASTPTMASRAVAARRDDRRDDLSIATTITGCLDLRDDGMFQLKDTDGEAAPKARSWKSGFIKKGSAKIDVFDAGNRLKLGNHVGSRVSLSGMLTDRQLRARSLESTSERCQ